MGIQIFNMGLMTDFIALSILSWQLSKLKILTKEIINMVKIFQGEILNLDLPETTLGVRMIFQTKRLDFWFLKTDLRLTRETFLAVPVTVQHGS